MKNWNNRHNVFAKLVTIISIMAFLLGFIGGCSAKDTNGSSSGQDGDNVSFEQIDEVCNSITELKNSKEFQNKDIELQTDLVLQEVKNLAKTGKIKSDSIICDKEDHIITFEYANGILGCDIVGGFKEGLDYYGVTSGLLEFDQVYKYNGDGPKADAIILNAMTDRSEVDKTCKELASTWQSYKISTKYDVTVTLDDLTNLKGYEFVYFKMHGAYMKFSYHGADREPCVFLEKARSRDNISKYDNDLKAHRIGISSRNECFITPSFVEAHYGSGDLTDNIWFFGCCELMGANGSKVSTAWEKVLKGRSVAAFVGFYNTNYTNYNLSLVKVFVNNLVKGKNVKESLDLAKNEYGSDDIKWHVKIYKRNPVEPKPAAYPILCGNKNATLKWEKDSSQESSLTTEPFATETTRSTTTAVSTTTSETAATAKAVGKTTISEAYKKSYTNSYGKFTARVPKITIAGVMLHSHHCRHNHRDLPRLHHGHPVKAELAPSLL